MPKTQCFQDVSSTMLTTYVQVSKFSESISGLLQRGAPKIAAANFGEFYGLW